MKNIEIKYDSLLVKKVIKTCLSFIIMFGALTISKIDIHASETDSPYAIQADIRTYTIATSDPKKIYFKQSTVNVAKYESYVLSSDLVGEPKVANTIPFLKGSKYHTGNPEIAFISGSRLIAKKEGKTWLYVETYNKLTAKVLINVTAQKDYTHVTFVDKSVKVGMKQSFNVNDYVYSTVTGGDINIVNIPKTNIKYTYRTGNNNIATVNEKGVVEGHAKGNTWLYVKSESGFENRVIVNVVDPQKNATSVTLPQTQTVNMREKVKLNAVVAPANSKVVSWRSGNTKVATVNQSGIVSGVSVGNTYIYAKLANGKEAKCLVKVSNLDSLRNNYKDIVTMKSDGLSLSIKYRMNSFGDHPAFDYTTSLKAKTGNPKVAVVSRISNSELNYGNIELKAIGDGNTWLNIETADGIKSKILIKVKKEPLKTFSMPSKLTIERYSIQGMKYNHLEIDGCHEGSVKFRTGNSKIATVDKDGYLTGVSAGNTYLYTECQGKTLKTLVTVTDGKAIKSINLGSSVFNINAKKSTSTRINATVSPSDAINQKLTFKTGNPKVATVDTYGNLQGKSNGNTYLYATAPNGVTTKALVKVTGFDEVTTVRIPKILDINLSEIKPSDRNDYRYYGTVHLEGTLNTAYANKRDDINATIGNNKVAEISSFYLSDGEVSIYLIPKSQGNTYLTVKMPNGKTVKTLIKVHW